MRGPAFFAYADNYLIDVKLGVIMDVEASRAIRQAEVGAAKTMIERTEERFGMRPERLVADTAYGSAADLNWLVNEKQIAPHIPVIDKSKREDGTFSREDFTFDKARDIYMCPAGEVLRTTGTVSTDHAVRYIAPVPVRRACPLKPKCCINAYKDEGWTPAGQSYTYFFSELKLAVRDARTFGESIRRAATGLYADVRLTVLTDADATRANLTKAIDTIAGEVAPRDTFILFAAAHGKSEAGRFYLIPQDYSGGPDPAALGSRAIDQTMLQDWLANRVKARKATILRTFVKIALRVEELKSRIKLAFPASYPHAAMLAAMTGAITTRGP